MLPHSVSHKNKACVPHTCVTSNISFIPSSRVYPTTTGNVLLYNFSEHLHVNPSIHSYILKAGNYYLFCEYQCKICFEASKGWRCARGWRLYRVREKMLTKLILTCRGTRVNTGCVAFWFDWYLESALNATSISPASGPVVCWFIKYWNISRRAPHQQWIFQQSISVEQYKFLNTSCLADESFCSIRIYFDW